MDYFERDIEYFYSLHAILAFIDDVTSPLQVFKKNMIGSSVVGTSSIQLPELFGSVKTIDDTRDKEFNMQLVHSLHSINSLLLGDNTFPSFIKFLVARRQF